MERRLASEPGMLCQVWRCSMQSAAGTLYHVHACMCMDVLVLPSGWTSRAQVMHGPVKHVLAGHGQAAPRTLG